MGSSSSVEPVLTAGLGKVLNVEPSHLAVPKTENMPNRFVFKPVRLSLERPAFEIADGLPDFAMIAPSAVR
jgi:hypothetical protein